MPTFAGKDVSKNTVINLSVGTLVVIVAFIWTALGIGRPLFASDLQSIEKKIDGYQTNTAIEILNIRKSALESELREARRDARRNPDDDDAADDVEDIKADIAELDAKILCHRTAGCEVETET